MTDTSQTSDKKELNRRLRPRKQNTIYVQSLRNHRKLNHKSANSGISSKQNEPFIGKVLPSLKYHQSSPPPQSYLCLYCDRHFPGRQSLCKHLDRIHYRPCRRESSVRCHFCNFVETDMNNLFLHLIEAHPNQYFACSNCFVRFANATDLCHHLQVVCAQKSTFGPVTSINFRQNNEQKADKTCGRVYCETLNEVGISSNISSINCSNLEKSNVKEINADASVAKNFIVPPSKLTNSSSLHLDKNAVVILDDIQLHGKNPAKWASGDHNEQILSRLGVVQRLRNAIDFTKRDQLHQQLESHSDRPDCCFDTKFYSSISKNVQDNLINFLDGTFKNQQNETVAQVRLRRNSVANNTIDGFPTLLAVEQYSKRNQDAFMLRSLAPNKKWKWDNVDNEKQISDDFAVMKKTCHLSNCIIGLVSRLDIWTQIRMRQKFDGTIPINTIVDSKKTEHEIKISDELRNILESRELPNSSSQPIKYVNRQRRGSHIDSQDFPAALGLLRSPPECQMVPAVLSGEWVRSRCYVCGACGQRAVEPRSLSAHDSTYHPHTHISHYEIVGQDLLCADILKHLYVPTPYIVNRTRPARGPRPCTKCRRPLIADELHNHMLECAGDSQVARRKCRPRPFGVRRRRGRVPNMRRPLRADVRPRSNRGIVQRPRIRTGAGDAETIRKMLADLPAKRRRISAIPENCNKNKSTKLIDNKLKKCLRRPIKEIPKLKQSNVNNAATVSQNDIEIQPDKNLHLTNNKQNLHTSSSIEEESIKKTSNTRKKTSKLKFKAKNSTMHKKLIKKLHPTEALKDINTYVDTNLNYTGGPSNALNNVMPFTLQLNPPQIPFTDSTYTDCIRSFSGSDNGYKGSAYNSNNDNANTHNKRDTTTPANQSTPYIKHSVSSLLSNYEPKHCVQPVANQNVDSNRPTELTTNTSYQVRPLPVSREGIGVDLDKPPLQYSNEALNLKMKSKTKKGLNDCIAMLKGKLVDQVCWQPSSFNDFTNVPLDLSSKTSSIETNTPSVDVTFKPDSYTTTGKCLSVRRKSGLKPKKLKVQSNPLSLTTKCKGNSPGTTIVTTVSVCPSTLALAHQTQAGHGVTLTPVNSALHLMPYTTEPIEYIPSLSSPMPLAYCPALTITTTSSLSPMAAAIIVTSTVTATHNSRAASYTARPLGLDLTGCYPSTTAVSVTMSVPTTELPNKQTPTGVSKASKTLHTDSVKQGINCRPVHQSEYPLQATNLPVISNLSRKSFVKPSASSLMHHGNKEITEVSRILPSTTSFITISSMEMASEERHLYSTTSRRKIDSNPVKPVNLSSITTMAKISTEPSLIMAGNSNTISTPSASKHHASSLHTDNFASAPRKGSETKRSSTQRATDKPSNARPVYDPTLKIPQYKVRANTSAENTNSTNTDTPTQNLNPLENLPKELALLPQAIVDIVGEILPQHKTKLMNALPLVFAKTFKEYGFKPDETAIVSPPLSHTSDTATQTNSSVHVAETTCPPEFLNIDTDKYLIDPVTGGLTARQSKELEQSLVNLVTETRPDIIKDTKHDYTNEFKLDDETNDVIDLTVDEEETSKYGVAIDNEKVPSDNNQSTSNTPMPISDSVGLTEYVNKILPDKSTASLRAVRIKSACEKQNRLPYEIKHTTTNTEMQSTIECNNSEQPQKCHAPHEHNELNKNFKNDFDTINTDEIEKCKVQDDEKLYCKPQEGQELKVSGSDVENDLDPQLTKIVREEITSDEKIASNLKTDIEIISAPALSLEDRTTSIQIIDQLSGPIDLSTENYVSVLPDSHVEQNSEYINEDIQGAMITKSNLEDVATNQSLTQENSKLYEKEECSKLQNKEKCGDRETSDENILVDLSNNKDVELKVHDDNKDIVRQITPTVVSEVIEKEAERNDHLKVKSVNVGDSVPDDDPEDDVCLALIVKQKLLTQKTPSVPDEGVKLKKRIKHNKNKDIASENNFNLNATGFCDNEPVDLNNTVNLDAETRHNDKLKDTETCNINRTPDLPREINTNQITPTVKKDSKLSTEETKKNKGKKKTKKANSLVKENISNDLVSDSPSYSDKSEETTLNNYQNCLDNPSNKSTVALRRSARGKSNMLETNSDNGDALKEGLINENLTQTDLIECSVNMNQSLILEANKNVAPEQIPSTPMNTLDSVGDDKLKKLSNDDSMIDNNIKSNNSDSKKCKRKNVDNSKESIIAVKKSKNVYNTRNKVLNNDASIDEVNDNDETQGKESNMMDKTENVTNVDHTVMPIKLTKKQLKRKAKAKNLYQMMTIANENEQHSKTADCPPPQACHNNAETFSSSESNTPNEQQLTTSIQIAEKGEQSAAESKTTACESTLPTIAKESNDSICVTKKPEIINLQTKVKINISKQAVTIDNNLLETATVNCEETHATKQTPVLSIIPEKTTMDIKDNVKRKNSSKKSKRKSSKKSLKNVDAVDCDDNSTLDKIAKEKRKKLGLNEPLLNNVSVTDCSPLEINTSTSENVTQVKRKGKKRQRKSSNKHAQSIDACETVLTQAEDTPLHNEMSAEEDLCKSNSSVSNKVNTSICNEEGTNLKNALDKTKDFEGVKYKKRKISRKPVMETNLVADIENSSNSLKIQDKDVEDLSGILANSTDKINNVSSDIDIAKDQSNSKDAIEESRFSATSTPIVSSKKEKSLNSMKRKNAQALSPLHEPKLFQTDINHKQIDDTEADNSTALDESLDEIIDSPQQPPNMDNIALSKIKIKDNENKIIAKEINNIALENSVKTTMDSVNDEFKLKEIETTLKVKQPVTESMDLNKSHTQSENNETFSDGNPAMKLSSVCTVEFPHELNAQNLGSVEKSQDKNVADVYKPGRRTRSKSILLKNLRVDSADTESDSNMQTKDSHKKPTKKALKEKSHMVSCNNNIENGDNLVQYGKRNRKLLKNTSGTDGVLEQEMNNTSKCKVGSSKNDSSDRLILGQESESDKDNALHTDILSAIPTDDNIILVPESGESIQEIQVPHEITEVTSKLNSVPKKKIDRQRIRSRRQTLAVCYNVGEEKNALPSDYFEDISFSSERRPRRSNILAAKRIAQTFQSSSSESSRMAAAADLTDEPTPSSSQEYLSENSITQFDTEGDADSQGTEGDPSSSDSNLARPKRRVRNGITETYCIICKKTFRRPDNYIRHKMTLMHISRLSEIESRNKDANEGASTSAQNYVNEAITDISTQEADSCIDESGTTAAVASEELSQEVELRHDDASQLSLSDKTESHKVTDLNEYEHHKTRVENETALDESLPAMQNDNLAGKALSCDEALFYECCSLLKESHKNDTNKTENSSITLNDSGLSVDAQGKEPHTKLSVECSPNDTRRLEFEEKQVTEKLLPTVEEQQPEVFNFSSPKDDLIGETEDNPENVTNITFDTTVNESMKPPVKKPLSPMPEIFEDKFDKIKRKCRSQAAAAARTAMTSQGLTSSVQSKKKKSEKKKAAKKVASTVPTKGALKGFDGIKVSIPTSEITLPESVHTSKDKKKKKNNSKKRKISHEIETKTKSIILPSNRVPAPKSTTANQLDVYEFLDNEHFDSFEFRTSSLPERYKLSSQKDAAHSLGNNMNNADDDRESGASASDGDDFVYMSDDYLCSEDETEASSMSCELANTNKLISENKKSSKRKDSLEKNAVMGRIFKNNAVRNDRRFVSKNVETKTTNSTSMDQLFDSLLENEPSSSMLLDDTPSPSKYASDRMGPETEVADTHNYYRDDSTNRGSEAGVARQRARRKCTVGKQNVLAETWSSESEPDRRPGRVENESGSVPRRKKGKKQSSGQLVTANSVRRSRQISFKNNKDITESRVNSSSKSKTARRDKRSRSEVAYYWSSSCTDEEDSHTLVEQHGWIVGDSHKKLVTMLAHAKGRKRDEKKSLIE